MFETLQALGALTQTIEKAYYLWDAGFSKAKNAHKQYIAFGVAIQNLGKNLDTVKSVIENADRQLRQERLHPFGQGAWDFDSLNQILGNYQKTLAECEKLLKDKSRFRHDSRNFVTNIVWNIEIEPQVVKLRDRLAFHNVKILMVLQPLELKLLVDLRDLIIDLHEDVVGRLDRIEGLLVNPPGETAADDRVLAARTLTVPEELSERFNEALIFESPECQDSEKLPLQSAMDAFVQYFKEGISSFETDSYLNLMKCLWIMGMVKQSAEYRQLSSSSLWYRYVNKLDLKLSKECERLTRALVPVPEIETVLRLPNDDFRIWKPDEVEDEENDAADNNFYLAEMLNISLPSERGKTKHSLRVLQNVDGTIQVQDTSSTVTGNKEINDVHRFDADLRNAHLIPMYASPSSTDTALNVKFKSDKNSANGISPSFGTLEDLLKFQEIITSYKTVFYRGGLDVECHSSARFSLVGSTSEEKGKVQIWQKKRSTPTNSDDGGSQRSVMSPITPAGPLPRLINLPNRRLSKMSTPALTKHFVEQWRRGSVGAGSIISSATSNIEGSVSSTIVSAQHASRLETGSATGGIRMDKPEIPKLILFLKSKSETISFLSVDMDEDTFINAQSCECRRTQSRCDISIVENKEGPLPARRIISGDGLQSWNLAALGASQQPPRPDPDALKDLRWIKLHFSSREDREKFAHRFNDVKMLYKRRLADFWRDMRIIQDKHVATEFKDQCE